MLQLRERKAVRRLALLFTLTYMCSYITRINYGAIVSEMVAALALPKSQLSMALTGSFITYGAGQIVSGICGDRFSPKKLVFSGLIVTSAMNCVLPFCSSPYAMLAVWCINGFAQAFLWPPMVRLMTALLSEDDYNRVTVKVSWGSSLGTIAVYFIAPLLISLFNWRAVFFFSAACGLIMAFVWNRYSYEIETEKKEKKTAEKGSIRALLSPAVIGIMAAIICQGMLRDGVTTWMPSYIAETFNISSMISIFTGVTLPLFGIVCFQLASKLYEKVFKDPVLCAGVIFASGALCSAGLYLFTDSSAVFSVIMSAVFTGCMHGVNLMLICILPPFFKKYGSVSTASGVLNSCTYIGSAVSAYGIAVISDDFGWHSTLLAWLITAVLGTALCFVCVRPWKKFVSE